MTNIFIGKYTNGFQMFLTIRIFVSCKAWGRYFFSIKNIFEAKFWVLKKYIFQPSTNIDRTQRVYIHKQISTIFQSIYFYWNIGLCVCAAEPLSRRYMMVKTENNHHTCTIYMVIGVCVCVMHWIIDVFIKCNYINLYKTRKTIVYILMDLYIYIYMCIY